MSHSYILTLVRLRLIRINFPFIAASFGIAYRPPLRAELVGVLAKHARFYEPPKH